MKRTYKKISKHQQNTKKKENGWFEKPCRPGTIGVSRENGIGDQQSIRDSRLFTILSYPPLPVADCNLRYREDACLRLMALHA